MRKTIADFPNGVYAVAEHASTADRGGRRYHLFSFDFDSTPLNLKDPEEHWGEEIKRLHLESRAQLIKRLEQEYGSRHMDRVVKNSSDLGAKSMSLLTYHNTLHEQARRAFVTGAYYPALVAACALGERILNHLLLDLRDSFKASPHYSKVYRKGSFQDWEFAVTVLTDWNILANDVRVDILALNKLRNCSVHFNPDTYESLRDDALAALQLLDQIISKQFGYFGGQPWFVEDTPGAQFVKRAYESEPFVQTYIVPRSGFVGPLFGMELTPENRWYHLDYSDYGDEELTDEEFATRFRKRDTKRVVSRAMIEQQDDKPG
ncbi:MAG: hypothetical protein GC186_18265 [Rhodobacteraceae bacterium]|nr:hypothetical protein [Paracoccaceae bacterium]